MLRLHKTQRSQVEAESRQQPTDAAPDEVDDEGRVGRNSLPALFVRPAGPNTFSGIQAVLSELIEVWRRRRSRRS